MTAVIISKQGGKQQQVNKPVLDQPMDHKSHLNKKRLINSVKYLPPWWRYWLVSPDIGGMDPVKQATRTDGHTQSLTATTSNDFS